MKVCFVALNTYPLLMNNNYGYVGGAEVQQYLLGIELRKQGCEVEFITYGDKVGREVTKEGIGINKIYDRDEVNSIPNFLKIFKLWRELLRLDHDIVFYESGAEGVLPILCRMRKKPIIFYIPSDANVDKKSIFQEWTPLMKLRNLFDLYFSDKVLCQSDYQKTNLKENFGIVGTIIKNGFPIKPMDEIKKGDRTHALWVSTINDVKQPEILLELAKRMPEVDFVMIGGKGREAAYFERIESEARSIKNVRFLGHIPFQEIQGHYEEASIFINTSRFEGFPNTFIQAWMGCTPVVSLNVDPDEIICEMGLGLHSRSVERMEKDIERLMSDEALRIEMGSAGWRYIAAEHNVSKVAESVIQIMDQLTNIPNGP